MAHPSQLPARYWHKNFPRPEGPPLFGLSFGQSRPDPHRLHDATWYNGHGEHLGTGDLDAADIERIKTEIPEGSYFIVRRADTRLPSETRPIGLEGLLASAELLITKDHAWWILFHPRPTPLMTRGITLPVITFGEAWERLRPLEKAEDPDP